MSDGKMKGSDERKRDVSLFYLCFLLNRREREREKDEKKEGVFFSSSSLSCYENYLNDNDGCYNAVACFYPFYF